MKNRQCLISRSNLIRGLSILTAGAVHALSFAPQPLPAQTLAVSQLLMLAVLAYHPLTATSVYRAAWQTWLFNLACYTTGLYWIFISLHVYGEMAWPLAVVAVLLFAAFLALFPTVAGVLTAWLIARGTPHPIKAPLYTALSFASCWTALEWVRGTLWTGFPWLNIGYAHLDSPLAGWAAVLGVYGVAWCAAFIASALTMVFIAGRTLLAREGWRGPRPLIQTLLHVERRGHRPPMLTRIHTEWRAHRPLVLTLMLASLLLLTGWGLSQVEWARPTGAPLTVRLIQGNIAQSQKFDPALMEKSLRQHLSQAAMPPAPNMPRPQLIVLPETILPVYQDHIDAPIWDRWRRLAHAQQATIVLGLPLHQEIAGHHYYTNSAIGIDAHTPIAALLSGNLAMRYDKHHLVPWGEFIPPGFAWLIQRLNIPLGSFDRGSLHQRPFSIRDQQLALTICYENLFGQERLSALHRGIKPVQGVIPAGASMLLNLSNLGWFGPTWALRQHLQISRMRTLETARPLLAATNTGITAAIDPHGRVIAQLPAMQAAVLDTTVQGMRGLTPYVRLGNWPILAALMLLGVGLISLRYTKLRL